MAVWGPGDAPPPADPAGAVPVTAAEFADLMARLGPWDGARRVAVACSGGADSMALAVLAAAWGGPLALVADHGLRPDSADEAALTADRLRRAGIAARVLALGLPPGSGAAAARAARHAALLAACAEAGIADLLLAHHRADQAETLLLRAVQGSGPDGLAGMAAAVARPAARLLRPLLGIPPARLRATLRAAGMGWVEDPSNRDPRALRPRLRTLLAAAERNGPAIMTAAAAARALGGRRASAERERLAALAATAEIRPEGFVLLSAAASRGPMAAAALATLLRAVAGDDHAPPAAAVARLAAAPRPATLGGVRLMPAGRLGPGLLLVREDAAMAPAVPARPGAVWDGRFRLSDRAAPPPGALLGALGGPSGWPEPARRALARAWPGAVLRTLPALWRDGALLAVPHLGWPDAATCRAVPVRFSPPVPAGDVPFVSTI